MVSGFTSIVSRLLFCFTFLHAFECLITQRKGGKKNHKSEFKGEAEIVKLHRAVKVNLVLFFHEALHSIMRVLSNSNGSSHSHSCKVQRHKRSSIARPLRSLTTKIFYTLFSSRELNSEDACHVNHISVLNGLHAQFHHHHHYTRCQPIIFFEP